MRSCLLILAVFLTAAAACSQSVELERMVYTKQFTLLNEKLKDPVYNKLPNANIYKAIVLNAFSQSAESNALIAGSLTAKTNIPDSLRFYLLQSQVNNFIALDDYHQAYSAGTALLKNFPSFFSKDQMEDEQEALKIWKQLAKVQPQRQKKVADTKLPLTKDIAGLWNIPVKVNDTTTNFIFDSGAGISTISDSYAQLLGLTIIENSNIEVKSGVTGISNKSRLGIAKELHIGNIVVNNAVFLIFPDSALSFANGAYVIKGIIGFPVIRAFGSFTITKNELFIPLNDTAMKLEPNMAIDQLKPVIYLSYNDEVLPFTFDTGAKTSVFSDKFYNRYATFIDKAGKQKEETVGGAGGSRKFTVVELPEISLKHYNKTVVLTKVSVSKDRIDANEDFYYGNLGQDIIKQYTTMTVNFKQSYILFE